MEDQAQGNSLTQSQIIELSLLQKNLGIQTEGVDVETQPIIQAIKYLIKPKQIGRQYATLQFQFENKNIVREQRRIAGSFIVSYQSNRVWWIRSAYVRKQCRSKGIFTKMFNRVLERARSNQIQKIKIYVNRDNSRAHHLYNKLGFRPTNQVFYCHEIHGLNKYFSVDSQKTKQKQYIVKETEVSNILDSIEMIADSKDTKNTNTSKYQSHIQVLEEEGRLLSTFQYYWQFSDWGCGLIMCISSIRVPKLVYQEIVNKTIQISAIMNTQIKHWLQILGDQKLTVTQIRLIGRSDSKPPILKYFDEGQFYEEDYNILSLEYQ